jgi:hypothetical protein
MNNSNWFAKFAIGFFIVLLIAIAMENPAAIMAYVEFALALGCLYFVWYTTAVIAYHYRGINKARRQAAIAKKHTLLKQCQRLNSGL